MQNKSADIHSALERQFGSGIHWKRSVQRYITIHRQQSSCQDEADSSDQMPSNDNPPEIFMMAEGTTDAI